ncbi:hypothetical protein COMA2_120158 [Candidatus Nitrospira nitrificans]|uniref:Fibronectin type-III domain-containing protein n=1 Tax=Candidatus Nitrospira nitrificans TaxID=1742973 RepID=A0A0S4L8X0_9BACT|nr:hypothetical protein COMA2_120158 [Candidatus Nitrospira nitrificans]
MTRVVGVTLTVPAPSPILTVSPAAVTFSGVQGGANPASQSVMVTSNGDWAASSSAPWLTLSPWAGIGNGPIAANVILASAPVGTNQATITVTSGSVTRVVGVTLTVPAPSPILTVSPAAVTFSGVQGGANPASQSVMVTSNGDWAASSSAPWLTLSPWAGTGNGSITANVTLASVAAGANQATITVRSGGVTRTTVVTFTVAPASLTASVNSLTYTATQGAANPAAQTIAISSNGTWTVSEGVPWLSLSPTSGSNNGIITANVNTAAATLGPNSTTITVRSGGITRTVNVNLTLNTQASVTLTWNANTESDLAGYKVYRATSSGAYGAPIAAIPGNTTSYIVTGLQSNTTYFFVVTAYDIAGNESAYSNEVSRSVY